MINNRLYIFNNFFIMCFIVISKLRISKVYFFDFYENKIFCIFFERKILIYCKKKIEGNFFVEIVEKICVKMYYFLDKLFICFEVINNIYGFYCRIYLIC